MTLIKSISGIRGTIGGKSGENLTPLDIVSCCAGYGTWLKGEATGTTVVIGRDARISGTMVQELAIQTLLALGLDVVDLDLSTTPTVEMAVVMEKAAGGIIITASHNPAEWNALKFLNHRGEFISAQAGADILQIIEKLEFEFAGVAKLGTRTGMVDSIQRHIQSILNLELVRHEEVRKKRFKVAVDCVNSTGALAMPPLLEALGCTYELINDEMTGDFAHNPEPIPQHLQELSQLVAEGGFDLGIALDPDVDRLVFICEDGSMFGEEYTIVALADYVLKYESGPTVSNLSSTQALKDVTISHSQPYFAAAVGEVNVVAKMKETNAVFGGEGNGGVIYPKLHYGRDALVGVALLLSHLAELEEPLSHVRAALPQYVISKNKVLLTPGLLPDSIIKEMAQRYRNTKHSLVDGLKIMFDHEWVHMRKSNTEPIIRIYAESSDQKNADALAQRFVDEIEALSAIHN